MSKAMRVTAVDMRMIKNATHDCIDKLRYSTEI